MFLDFSDDDPNAENILFQKIFVLCKFYTEKIIFLLNLFPQIGDIYLNVYRENVQ